MRRIESTHECHQFAFRVHIQFLPNLMLSSDSSALNLEPADDPTIGRKFYRSGICTFFLCLSFYRDRLDGVSLDDAGWPRDCRQEIAQTLNEQFDMYGHPASATDYKIRAAGTRMATSVVYTVEPVSLTPIADVSGRREARERYKCQSVQVSLKSGAEVA